MVIVHVMISEFMSVIYVEFTPLSLEGVGNETPGFCQHQSNYILIHYYLPNMYIFVHYASNCSYLVA